MLSLLCSALRQGRTRCLPCRYTFYGLFMGLMYLQLNDSVATGVQDRAASLWFAMAMLSFT